MRTSLDRRSSDVLVSELLLRHGLLRNGLEAPSAFGLRAGGASHSAAFSQVTSERSVVDLLEVLLDFDSGMFQKVRLALRE